MKSRAISATEFKAKCLALLGEMAEEGGAITTLNAADPLPFWGRLGEISVNP